MTNSQHPIRLLLVEDNPGDIRLIEEALAQRVNAHFTKDCVSRLSDALNRISAGNIDVILLDLSLPDSQGLETFVRIQQAASHMPIIVLSGLDDEVLAIDSVQKGAQDYLVKGEVDGPVLARAIHYAIERKHIEEELRIANERFRLAAAAVNSVIYDWDMVHDRVIWSIGLEEMFGYDPSSVEPTGHWWLSHLHPDDRQRVHGQLLRDIAQGQDFVAEYRFLHASDKYLDVWDRGRMQCGENGRVVRMIGTIVDITARKEAERMKDEFVSTVSHELRTPLATMKEFTEILVDQISGPLNTTQQEHLTIIKSNIERLSRIVGDMLDIAKIEAGHIQLRRELFTIGPFIEQIFQTFRPIADAKGVTLKVSLPANGSLMAFADGDKLTQILINLINNAIKYIPNQGNVTVSVEEQSNEMQFRVQDTGIGISEQDMPRLFEKFQQFRRVRGMRGAEGTGLGLAISKRLVELHGGRIWASSVVGQGTAFYFTIPKYSSEEIFRDRLRGGIVEARRRQSRFSLIVCAVSNFEELKTLYGFGNVGLLLKELETMLQCLVREQDGDIVIRWQHGEMLVILAEVDQAGAQTISQRLIRMVEQHPFSVGAHSVLVNLSTAIATYPDEAMTEDELLCVVEGRLHRLSTPKIRVMIIDDEIKIRQLIKEALELRGFEVFTAASGPEALEQLKHNRIDLILLDLTMPVMDGYEVYHVLKEIPQTQDIPVLIVTGRGERKDRSLGFKDARYNYIDKPFEIEELIAKVRGMLQESKSKRWSDVAPATPRG